MAQTKKRFAWSVQSQHTRVPFDMADFVLKANLNIYTMPNNVDALNLNEESASQVSGQVRTEGRDIVMVMDVSGSMGGEPINMVSAIYHKLVDYVGNAKFALDPHADRLCVIAFGSKIVTLVNFTDSSSSWSSVQFTIEGSTNMDGGLSAAFNAIENRYDSSRRVAIMLMTDGSPNVGRVGDELVAFAKSRLQQLIQQTGQDIPFFALGFGASHEPDLLRKLAAGRQDQYMFVKDATTIDVANSIVFNQVRRAVVIQNATFSINPRPDNKAFLVAVEKGQASQGEQVIAPGVDEPDDSPWLVMITDVAENKSRNLLMEFELDALDSPSNGALPICLVTLVVKFSDGVLETETKSLDIIRDQPRENVPFMKPNEYVSDQVSRDITATALDTAAELVQGNNASGALKVLEQAETALAANYAPIVNQQDEPPPAFTEPSYAPPPVYAPVYAALPQPGSNAIPAPPPAPAMSTSGGYSTIPPPPPPPPPPMPTTTDPVAQLKAQLKDNSTTPREKFDPFSGGKLSRSNSVNSVSSNDIFEKMKDVIGQRRVQMNLVQDSTEDHHAELDDWQND